MRSKALSLIIHAGDVGKPEVLDALKRLPRRRSAGNVDRGPWADTLPLTAIVKPGIYVLHDVKELDFDPSAKGYRMVVSGHSHKPSQTERAGVLYVNPGAAGPRRFRLPVTVARLDVRQWVVEFVDLTA